jgi:hypothetical protein
VNIGKRIIVTAGGAALAAGLMAGTASASTDGGPYAPWHTTTAVTYVVTYQVPGGGGPWAEGRVWRDASVTLTGWSVPSWNCGGATSGTCYAFTAALRDSGTFRAYKGALTPNQGWPYTGRHIRSSVSGWVNGWVDFGTFYANTLPSRALVPFFYVDSTGFSSSVWPEEFFPSGDTFGVTTSAYSYTFSAWTRCGFQQWTSSSYNGNGQQPGDGNIRGCYYSHRHWYV